MLYKPIYGLVSAKTIKSILLKLWIVEAIETFLFLIRSEKFKNVQIWPVKFLKKDVLVILHYLSLL